MKQKLVRLDFVDNALDELLDNYVLVDPDENKLAELKQMVETRWDTDGLTDEEIAAKDELCDNIWERIEQFIAENFIVLDISETYEIWY